jgi:4-aminobutyrate aminotransferase
VLYAALARGLSFKTTMGNVLTFTPPLVTTPEQLDAAMDIVDACLTDVERALGRSGGAGHGDGGGHGGGTKA